MAATGTEVERAETFGGSGLVPIRQSPAALQAQANEIRDLMRAVLREGVDYGHIPNVERPMLFKSGAEWLLKWAGYGHRLERVDLERDEHGRKFSVTYRATVHPLDDVQKVVATCEGYCGYDEDRYYQSVETLEAKERFNASKYKRAVKSEKWAKEYRAPFHSLMRMAQKRAMVGATVAATASSGIFADEFAPQDAAPDLLNPTAWAEYGWESEAEHNDFRTSLRDLLASMHEEDQAEFKAWRTMVGYNVTGPASSRDEAEEMKAKAEALQAERAQRVPTTTAPAREEEGDEDSSAPF